MKNWLLDILACPFCRKDIAEEKEQLGKSSLGDRLWFLYCKGCGTEFPVFLNRPIFVPKGMEGVLSAIDQAVGWTGPRRSSECSLAWLGEQQSLGKDLTQLVVWKSAQWKSYSRSEWVEVLEDVREHVEDRRIGENLEWILAPLPEDVGERKVLDEFAARVVKSGPRRLLDVASGGGWGLLRSLAHMDDLEYVVGMDKDLKCVWGVQYRVEHISRSSYCEAVGADARILPFKDESFDFATSFHSLGEICGISDFLAQVYRVLIPGGRFQLSFHNLKLANYVEPERVESVVEYSSKHTPQSSETLEYISTYLPHLGAQEFLEFLKVADLFINFDHLISQVHDCGFRDIDCYFHPADVKPGTTRPFKDDVILLIEKPDFESL